MALLVIVGTWAGNRLDVRLGTSPVFLFLGIGGGMASGLYLLARTLKEQNDEPRDPTP